MNDNNKKTTGKTKRRILWLSIRVIIYIGVFMVIVCFVQRRMLFPRHAIDQQIKPGPNIEVDWLDTDQGKVEMWFISGKNATPASPSPTVFFAHGNGELIDYSPEELYHYTQNGINIILCEYRGYGRSAGSPSQKRIIKDFTACYDLTIKRPNVDPQRVFYHGRSLGGGVLCDLAKHREPRLIILQSTFTSVPDLAKHFFFFSPRFLIFDQFDNTAFLTTFDKPVLIAHGKHDKIIPFKHGQKLHALTPNSRFLEFNSDHNDFPVMSRKFINAINDFLRENSILPAQQQNK